MTRNALMILFFVLLVSNYWICELVYPGPWEEVSGDWTELRAVIYAFMFFLSFALQLFPGNKYSESMLIGFACLFGFDFIDKWIMGVHSYGKNDVFIVGVALIIGMMHYKYIRKNGQGKS